MSDARVLICGPAIDAAESADRLDMLGHIKLPTATKFVITTGKFDAHKAARTFNVEADYPAEPAHLQTLARSAETSSWPEPRFRDGYDLFCLRRLLAKHEGFDFAVLLREGTGFDERWSELRSRINGKLFVTFDVKSPSAPEGGTSTNLLIDLTDKRASVLLDRAGRLYASGTVYAIAAYSLDDTLHLALDALRLEQLITPRLERAENDAASESGRIARLEPRSTGGAFTGHAVSTGY